MILLTVPNKDCGLKHGPRLHVLSKQLWKDYLEVSKKEVSWEDFKKIILTSNKAIANRVLNNVPGFKLPEGLGFLGVKRYKPKQGVRSVDFGRTRKEGVVVYHTNFHSYGYKARILWYTSGISWCKHIGVYKFIPDRSLQRALCVKVKEGKVYSDEGYDYYKSKKIKINFNRLD